MSSKQVSNIVEEENKKEVPAGKPKSGKWWKPEVKKFSSIIKNKAITRKTWDKKVEERKRLEAVKRLQQEMKDQIIEKKRLAQEKREEKKRRQEENTKKNEIVQVIKNTEKLRRMKKKDLRKLVKRDTN
uniref:Coiled-coil domain-containing protein 86 n=1 Tax=Parastrongyloides trichosuri TaxID=131310 RepID=A0A0N5A554_PARTI